MIHVIDYVVEPRRDGCIAIITVDNLPVARQKFRDWDEATAWAERQVAARKEGASA